MHARQNLIKVISISWEVQSVLWNGQVISVSREEGSGRTAYLGQWRPTAVGVPPEAEVVRYMMV